MDEFQVLNVSNSGGWGDPLSSIFKVQYFLFGSKNSALKSTYGEILFLGQRALISGLFYTSFRLRINEFPVSLKPPEVFILFHLHFFVLFMTLCLLFSVNL